MDKQINVLLASNLMYVNLYLLLYIKTNVLKYKNKSVAHWSTIRQLVQLLLKTII